MTWRWGTATSRTADSETPSPALSDGLQAQAGAPTVLLLRGSRALLVRSLPQRTTTEFVARVHRPPNAGNTIPHTQEGLLLCDRAGGELASESAPERASGILRRLSPGVFSAAGLSGYAFSEPCMERIAAHTIRRDPFI